MIQVSPASAYDVEDAVKASSYLQAIYAIVSVYNFKLCTVPFNLGDASTIFKRPNRLPEGS
jgi:hypothetical protein